jgi:U2-associated protein SR140
VVGQKLSQYAQGSVRKSRREKEKEAAEAKKKEEEEDAARAYAEFIETFEGEDGGKDAGLSFVKASSETAAPYVPAFKTPTEPGSGSGRASNRERMVCLIVLPFSSTR